MEQQGTVLNRKDRVIIGHLSPLTVCALTTLALCEAPCQASDRPIEPLTEPDSLATASARQDLPGEHLSHDNIALPEGVESPETALVATDSSIPDAALSFTGSTVEISGIAAPEATVPGSREVSTDTRVAAIASPEPEPISPLTQPLEPGTLVAQTEFGTSMSSLFDIRGHWAEDQIQALEDRGIVKGFPDSLYRPDQRLTRAQFAALLQRSIQQIPALANANLKPPTRFRDVPPTYWGYAAIQTVDQQQFLKGYPNNRFGPEQPISRTEVLVALVRGFKLNATQLQPETLNRYFEDANEIPAYARSAIVAAIENRLAIDYPFTRALKPNQAATRAEAATLLHQALVQAGLLPALSPTVATQPNSSATGNSGADNPETAQAAEQPIPDVRPASPEVIENLESRLQALQASDNFGDTFEGSPAITIANPPGFGADDWTGFVAATFQPRTRYTSQADGAATLGLGLGDSRQAVGLELSYTMASFGTSRGFGSGGFNAKLHRQFPDDWAVAVGWNGFANIGGFNDFQNSIYGSVSKVIRTRDSLDLPFSRIALTAGVGSGQFRSEADVTQNRSTVGVFGSLAIRAIQPLSLITEWTGQDLGVGLSIVPLADTHWVITTAVRDIVGAGNGPRFVFGTGFSFKF